MIDTPATRNVHRAQLLGMATSAQQGLDLDDPADYWYRTGQRDAYAYAAALLGQGRVGDPARAAADRVTQLLANGFTDLGVLLDATQPEPPLVHQSLTWVGPIAFQQLLAHHDGVDHDLGTTWGPRHDVRISHHRPHDGTTGLLYAYDRTWDEYVVLAAHATFAVAERVYRRALDRDPHLGLADVLTILHADPSTPQRAPAVTGPEPLRAEP